MSQPETIRKPLIKTDCEPVNSSHKLKLLLQRSARYSYRQKCCGLCPNILCEILFPIILIVLLGLARFGINKLNDQVNKPGSGPPDPTMGTPCSQNASLPPISSNDIFKKCFQFPPRYADRWFGDDYNVSNQTNIIFEPAGAETDELVNLARARLQQMDCSSTDVW